MIFRSEFESFKLRFLFLSLANSFMRLWGRAIVYSGQRAPELMLVNNGVDGGEWWWVMVNSGVDGGEWWWWMVVNGGGGWW